jgi:membrane glycosyltransferase
MVGLMFGRSVVWGGQSRDAEGLSWAVAARHLWPQMLFGAVVCGALLFIAPAVLWWSLPLTAGYLLAVPFAVLSADPRVGRTLQRLGVCGIPEDFNAPVEVKAVLANLADQQ